jgi:enoyl-CoA hydratase
MVNHVVDREALEEFTLKLAQRIARFPSMALKLAKQSVNQSLDAQGQWAAIQAAFNLHQLGHSHNMQVYGNIVDPNGMAIIQEQSRQES